MSNENENAAPEKKPCGCSGELHLPEINKLCEAPTPMPWVECNNCMKFYVVTDIYKQGTISLNDGPSTNDFQTPVTVEFEITYEFSLCLRGRQPGKLVYTTTLIPQEEMRIYVSDRFRQVTDITAMVSSQSSFKQSVYALQQSQASADLSSYTNNIKNSNASGGDSFDFLGIVSTGDSNSSSSSSQNAQSIDVALSSFQQTIVAASSSVESQRSLVISNYEDTDKLNVTSRVLKNFNNTRAVTYYIRQVTEVYDLSVKISSIRWRITEIRVQGGYPTGWQSVAAINTITIPALKKFIETQLEQLPKLNSQLQSETCFTLPTDGTFIEAELAHCSSADAERMKELELALERTQAETRKLLLETELMHLEIERRKKLLEAGDLNMFNQPVGS